MPQTWQYVRSCQSRIIQTTCQKSGLQNLQSQKVHTTKHLQSLKVDITFVVQESKHCQLLQSKKVHTTNLCSLKKQTLQTFVVLKSEHYKLCSKKADATNFCNKKSRHYKLFQWMAQTNISKQKSQKCTPWVLLSLCCSPLYEIPETKNRIWSLQCFCTYPSYFPIKYVP